MEKPRVIVFTTAYYPFVGGSEIAIEEICRRLKDRFDFYIVTSRFRRDLPGREVRSEGTVIRVGFGNGLDKYLLPFWKLTNLDTPCPSMIVGVDISHASIAAAIYKFLHPRTPFLLNIQFGESGERLASGRLGVMGLAFKFMLWQADYVTAISTYLLELARDYGYRGRAEVLPNGVDIGKFAHRPSPIANRTKKVVVTISRLVSKNGIDILIRAIAEVKKIIPDVQCWIIGDGLERASYQSLVTSCQLGNNVKFFGEIPHERIPEYLHRADIFVRPSRSEGMGNSFIEALAAGLPIIGTPVGGITDIIEDPSAGSGRATGLFAERDDPHDLAEKIIHLLRDHNLAASIAREGLRMVRERFLWDKISEQYGVLFSQHRVLTILIATPLLPPQLGGPALYVKHLGDEFKKMGHRVRTVSFGHFLRYPSGLRHLLYFFALLPRALRSDLIFALDYTSVGFPTAVAAWFLRKPLIIRVEGDFLWEKFVERTRLDVTLPMFYGKPQPLSFKERLILYVSGWVMRRATRLGFSSEWRRQMIIDAYRVPVKKTVIIRNAFPFVGNPTRRQRGNVILWAGRMLYLKNLHRLIRAFASIDISSYELYLVGEGPEKKNIERLVREQHAERRIKFFPAMSHQELMEKLALSTAVILPSLSDVGPNVVAEAIGALVPVIMTKESGYAEVFHDAVILIDPLDEADLREKLKKFIEKPAERTIPKIGFSRSWTAAAKDWLSLFNTL